MQTRVRKRVQKSAKGCKRAQKGASAEKLQTTRFEPREKLYTPPPPSPIFGQKAFWGGGVHILSPHAAGFLYAPLFYTPPTPRRVFWGVGGGFIKFGPVLKQPGLGTPQKWMLAKWTLRASQAVFGTSGSGAMCLVATLIFFSLPFQISLYFLFSRRNPCLFELFSPSFPRIFSALPDFPWYFQSKEIPWCFEAFQLFSSDFSRVFTGVERAKNPWCLGWFSCVFT